MNESSIDLGEIWAAVRRRAWLLVVSIALITPIGLLVALLLPPYYSSTARILVQSQRIPNELVKSTVEMGSNERLALIHQRLTTRDNLLAMADRLTLFDNRTELSPTDIVDSLRDAIEVEEIELRQSTRSRTQALASAFTVKYSSRDPVTAARVANELVTMVLRENLETRSRIASETREFIQKRADDLANALAQLEREIARFKAANGNSLPESLPNRQDELLALQERTFELERQRVNLEEQQRALADAIEAGATPESINARQQLTPEEQRLRQLQQELAQNLGIYTESHPKVIALRSSIASLEAANAAGAPVEIDPANADKNQLTRQEELLAQQRERNLELVKRQLELVTKQADQATARMKALRDSIAATPDTELALTALVRRRDEIAEQHQQATRKAAVAVAGEELEINRQAERYEIIEQAQIPEKPDSPPRKLIAVGSFAASIGLGIALMVLFELLNSTIRTTRQMASRVGIAPIVAIPLIRTAHETTQKRLTTGLYALLLIGLGAGFLFLVDQYVTPIDRLVTNFLDDAKLTPVVEQARENFGQLLERITAWLRNAADGVI